jgi:hypothetical protein
MKPEDKLYSDIENSIMKWSNDGNKTAGFLTRKILKLIPPYVKVTNKHISEQDEIIFELYTKLEISEKKLKNLKKKSYSKAKVESLLHKATIEAANNDGFDFWDFIEKHLK